MTKNNTNRVKKGSPTDLILRWRSDFQHGGLEPTVLVDTDALPYFPMFVVDLGELVLSLVAEHPAAYQDPEDVDLSTVDGQLYAAEMLQRALDDNGFGFTVTVDTESELQRMLLPTFAARYPHRIFIGIGDAHP